MLGNNFVVTVRMCVCVCVCVCACVLNHFSRVWLCHPMDYSPPGSSVHGTLQTRILEWVAMPSSRRSFWPRDSTCSSCSSCVAGRFLPPSQQGSLLCSCRFGVSMGGGEFRIHLHCCLKLELFVSRKMEETPNKNIQKSRLFFFFQNCSSKIWGNQ